MCSSQKQRLVIHCFKPDNSNEYRDCIYAVTDKQFNTRNTRKQFSTQTF